MAHKYTNLLIHVVFSTKERRNLIPEVLQPKLWKYFNGIGSNCHIPMLAPGGMANHAHLLVALPSDVSVAKAVQTFKANSSRWIWRTRHQFRLAGRLWRFQRQCLAPRRRQALR